jgi:hypothetical protein
MDVYGRELKPLTVKFLPEVPNPSVTDVKAHDFETKAVELPITVLNQDAKDTS